MMATATRDSFLCPWRIPKGQPLVELIDELEERLSDQERLTTPRERRRRPADQRRWRELLEAVICGLAYEVLAPSPTGRLVLPLKTGCTMPARYRHPAFGKCRSRLLDLLHSLSLIDLRKHRKVGTATTIAPTPVFAEMVRRHRVEFTDFGRNAREEVLLLTRSERKGAVREKTLIDYPETGETQALRDQVRRINEYLARADVEFIPDGRGPVNPYSRTLARRFTVLPGQEPRFDQGGRLFGGFWENLEKTRRAHIRIAEEPVTVLDFSAMFTRLAYAEAGQEPPTHDPYAIPALAGLHRGLVKRAVNAMYFTEGEGRRTWPDELRELMPTEWTPHRFRQAVLGAHPVLASLHGITSGFQLMFLESRILVAVLLTLMDRDIVALGLHDGLMVAQSKAWEARHVMEEVSREIALFTIPVSGKHVTDDLKEELRPSSYGEPITPPVPTAPHPGGFSLTERRSAHGRHHH